MVQTEHSTLRGAIDRLRWAVSQPLWIGDPAWAQRLQRALVEATTMLGKRVAAGQSGPGWLDAVYAPALWQTWPSAEQAAQLQAGYHELHSQSVQLQKQLRRVTACVRESPEDGAGRSDRAWSATQVQAFRRLHRIAAATEQLLAAVEHQLAHEAYFWSE